MSKKIISLLLAVMLTVSMVAVAAVSVSAETDEQGRYYPGEGIETNRYYFYMPSDWCNEYAETAGIYWWDAPDSIAWPGYLAQPTEVPGIYYCDTPADAATIIWNNGFDGGEDQSTPEYSKAIQSVNIGAQWYDPDESENYPEGLESFDNMIYVINPEFTEVNDFNGKVTCGGEWYYYYGNGEYGFKPTKEEAAAAGCLYNTEYQPPKGGAQDPTVAPTEEPTEAPTEAPTTATEPVTSTEAPLTVKATSNYFPEATAEYNEETKEVTVTYYLQASKGVIDTQWELSYDPSVLSISSKTNVMTLCPTIGTQGAYFNPAYSEGLAKYNASNMYLYNFSEKKEFVKVIFDVKDLSGKTPVSTVVDLQVDVLRVGTPDPATMISTDEITLIDFFEVKNNADANSINVVKETALTESTYVPATTPVETTAPTEPATDAPAYPYLTVNATSNYFPATFAEYNSDVKEVTVTYYFKSSKDVIDTQWCLYYDADVLTLSDKNTLATVSPAIGEVGAIMNTGVKGIVKYNASNLYLYDFSEETPFVQFVFDVNDIADKAPVITTVDLQVDVLRVSKAGEDGMTIDEEEVSLVDFYEVINNAQTAGVNVNRRTEITPPSTYIPPVTEAPTTEEPTTEVPTEAPTTEEPTEAPTDAPVTEEPTDAPATEEPTEAETTVPAADEDATSATESTVVVDGESTSDNAGGSSNGGAVQTGDASLAVVILTLLIAATSVMFVLRKREML